MNKKELKQLIKPIVKECINEVLLQEGVLSSIISEVMKGTSTPPLREQPERAPPPQVKRQSVNEQLTARRQKSSQSRQKLLDAVGTASYNGVNLFEGTEPLNKGGTGSNNDHPQGALSNYAPEDAGVDITGLMSLTGDTWKKIK